MRQTTIYDFGISNSTTISPNKFNITIPISTFEFTLDPVDVQKDINYNINNVPLDDIMEFLRNYKKEENE